MPVRPTPAATSRPGGRGFLLGGSTGTVVSGAMSWLAQHAGPELTAVAISPDLGERYLDTSSTGSMTCTAKTCSTPAS